MPNHPHRLPAPPAEALAAAYAQVPNVVGLARHYHVSYSTALGWLRERGISRRPPGVCRGLPA